MGRAEGRSGSRPRNVGEIVSLKWDDEVIEKVRLKHGFGPRLANQVKDDLPLFFLNALDKAATHLMVGQSEDGRYWVVAIKPTDEAGVWRVLTGFEAGLRQVESYDRWIGQPLERIGETDAQKKQKSKGQIRPRTD
jgi:hypothetical protein